MYVTKPLMSLLWAWKVKLPLAVAIAWLWELVKPLGGVYEQLLTADPVLVVLAVTMMGVDFVTGLMRALREGEPISSRRMRGAGWKLIEYAVVVGVCIMLANGALRIDSPLAAPLTITDDAGLLYVTLTEAFSIFENIYGSKARAHRAIEKIRGLLRGEWTIEKSNRKPSNQKQEDNS